MDDGWHGFGEGGAEIDRCRLEGRRDGLLVWRRLRGDFIVRARVRLPRRDPAHRLGWAVRSGPREYAATLTGAGRAELAGTPAPINGADMLQLSRRGTELRLGVARFGEPLTTIVRPVPDLADEIELGLFAVGPADFEQLRLIRPAPDDWRPADGYLTSRLEILDVVTGKREIVHRAPDSLQAPNWTPDGRALIYNRNGRLYRFDLTDRTVELIDTGFADRNNNDHVLSPDGRWLGLSHHSADDDGRSIIYVVPVEGGQPRRVTDRGPSYLHGWSPDGRTLVYTARRGGQFDIWAKDLDGSPERRLTDHPALDDGPDYSPDGQWIYFNSHRGGLMQLWRMRPDGGGVEQLTDDGFNNWFPHPSPDGRQLAFLSYGPEVDPAAHPFYREVYLRLMPAGGGPARVVAYVYGGQGTINVPSWAPDSRRLAFVSNSGLGDD